MGAIRDFLFPQVQTAKPTKVSDVAAALTPVQISDSVYNILGGATNTTRQLVFIKLFKGFCISNPILCKHLVPE